MPFKDKKALPNLTNQAMDRNLKKLCKLAGIDEEIRVTTYNGNVRSPVDEPLWSMRNSGDAYIPQKATRAHVASFLGVAAMRTFGKVHKQFLGYDLGYKKQKPQQNNVCCGFQWR